MSGLPVGQKPLRLGSGRFRILLEAVGPSLGLWRGAEIAALREVNFPPPVLDVGCGDGLVASQALWYVDVGLDPRRDALARASRSNMYGRLIPSCVEDADLPEESMGSVLCNSVIEHIPAMERTLDAIHRVLKPAGLFVLTCPTSSFSGWLALPGARYGAWRNRKLEHHVLLTARAWLDILRRHGFSVETIRPYLRRRLVFAWDALELVQLLRLRGTPVFSRLWKKSPSILFDVLALAASRLDLASPDPGGGHMIVARKNN